MYNVGIVEFYQELLAKTPHNEDDDYEELLEAYEVRRAALVEYAKANDKTIRSVTTTLVRYHLYIPKPKKLRTENSNLTALLNRYETSPQREQIERLRDCKSKEIMLSELEDKLGLERYALYSLKSATKVDLVNLIIGIENYVTNIKDGSH